jgi:hypothetical protein
MMDNENIPIQIVKNLWKSNKFFSLQNLFAARWSLGYGRKTLSVVCRMIEAV